MIPKTLAMARSGLHQEPVRLALVTAAKAGPVSPARGRLPWTLVVGLAWTLALTVAFGLVSHPGLLVAAAMVGLVTLISWLRQAAIVRSASSAQSPAHLSADRSGVHLVTKDAPPERVFSLAPRFGFALFSTADRSRLVVAVTNGGSSLWVGADVGPADRKRLSWLMSHAVTACREDLAMAMQSTRGPVMLVDTTSLLRLIDLMTQVDATSFGRLMLTDNVGREVVLERDRLLTGRCTIRLDQPLEWRGLVFREGNGAMGVEYQGTWVRQGKSEMVLVSLMAGDVRQSIHEVETRTGGWPDAMLRQDAVLANGSPAAPPPVEQRVAVDRLFMLPLRRALDAAQFEKRDSIPGDASLGG
jgi:hypothetical protein